MSLFMKIISKEFTEKEAIDLLRQFRENNERRSKEVESIGMLYNTNVKNASERYMIMEQMIFAMLDCHMYGGAAMEIYCLSQAFPGSMRVMRYKAMLLEAEEKYDEALEILDRIIKADETNAPARKRRIAIMKAQGQITEAIKELVDYLKKFMSDVEGWQQLCELYLQAGELQRAAFCAEELLLHQPHCHLHHQRLADIRYTMGGVENMELAKSYYCHALKLNPDNMRATLGLFLTTTNLLNHYKSSGNSSKRKEVWKLSQWVQTKAARRTALNHSTQLTNMMLNLAITE
ncbi:unnamed protein product [Diatraea saccharalis]|uniref:ER membrane protein complex subunit 2 n=1 Tax=Diatraea saccharalis TaxID=40085 RepID=A0A9N9WCK5_9NEOP|nr:unnamed protein product [Diatraea saccharalis]